MHECSFACVDDLYVYDCSKGRWKVFYFILRHTNHGGKGGFEAKKVTVIITKRPAWPGSFYKTQYNSLEPLHEDPTRFHGFTPVPERRCLRPKVLTPPLTHNLKVLTPDPWAPPKTWLDSTPKAWLDSTVSHLCQKEESEEWRRRRKKKKKNEEWRMKTHVYGLRRWMRRINSREKTSQKEWSPVLRRT